MEHDYLTDYGPIVSDHKEVKRYENRLQCGSMFCHVTYRQNGSFGLATSHEVSYYNPDL